MSTLLHLADRVLNRPLLIMPEKASLIAAVLAGRIGIDASGLRPDPESSRFVGSQATEDDGGKTVRKPFTRTSDGVGIITVTGSLINRGAWVGASSGLTSYEGIKAQLASAAADGATKSIILDLHSPGGEAIGAFEAADAVRAAASVKPVVAVVNGMAASAAYAMASAASRIVTTQSGLSGSIGVVMMHADFSRSLDKDGVTPTLIFAGDHKVDGNPFEPLPDDVRESLQAEVNTLYDMFVAGVGQGRKNMSPAAIRGTQAKTYIGQAAVDVGLADDVGTFESVLAELSRAPKRGASTRSQTGASRMSDETITLEAHHNALNGLRQEGERAVAAARLEGSQSAAAARQEGKRSGAEAERARIQAITSHPEAEGRGAQAFALAMTGATIEQASALLVVTPKGAAGAATTLDQRATLATATLPSATAPAGGAPASMSDFDKGKAIATRFAR